MRQPFIDNDFEKVLFERHSVRNFDPEVKIPREELSAMVEEAITAPSACNLQSWHFEVLDTNESREKLRSFMMKFNTPQLDSASAFVFLFGDTQSFKKYESVWNTAFKNGEITAEKRDEILNTFLPLYKKADQSFLTLDAAVDASLAAMQFMLIARGHGYQTNPIGGYDAKKAAAALGLDPARYVPVMTIAIGKPAKNQPDLVKTPRYDVKDVLHFQ